MDHGGSWFLDHVSLKLQFDATLKTIESSLLLMWCWMILVGCFFEGKWKQCNKTQFWLDEMMEVFHSLLVYIVKVNQQITLLWLRRDFPAGGKDSVSRRCGYSVICRLPVNAPKMINWLTLVSCKQMDLGGSWFLEHVSLKLQFDATLKTIENSLLLMWCWMILVGCFSEGKWKQCNKTQFWLDKIEMMDVFRTRWNFLDTFNLVIFSLSNACMPGKQCNFVVWWELS